MEIASIQELHNIINKCYQFAKEHNKIPQTMDEWNKLAKASSAFVEKEKNHPLVVGFMVGFYDFIRAVDPNRNKPLEGNRKTEIIKNKPSEFKPIGKPTTAEQTRIV